MTGCPVISRREGNVAEAPSNFEFIKAGCTLEGEFDAEYNKPEWFDKKLFREGQEFYKTYKVGCVTSMLISLVMGLSFKDLLEVLVFTNRSETPKKAFWRYFHTLIHTDSWFMTDIFDPHSTGYKSIKKVRIIHNSVALRITKAKGEPDVETGSGKRRRKWLSQTDLSYTLIGFAGSILIAPRSFGVTDTKKLEGYIHYWRVLGYLHGIEDAFNPFGGSMRTAQNTIADVTADCLIPSLESPPKDFDKMVEAVCSWAGGKNGTIAYGLHIILTNHKDLERPLDENRVQEVNKLYPLDSFRDKIRFNHLYLLFRYLYPVPFARILLNFQFDAGLFFMTLWMNFKVWLAKCFDDKSPAEML